MSAPTILDALDDEALFGSAFASPSWRPWRAALACLFGLPLDEDQRALVESCTGRTDLPAAPFREAWLCVGRRAGKSRKMAAVAVHLACFRDWRAHLAPGEVATVAVIAADRAQARVVHRYVKGLIAGNLLLAPLVLAETAERIELSNRVAVEIFAASSVRVRGYTLCAVLLDEVAYWPTDDAADPDTEILAALRPGLATLPGSLLVAASSPHARRGELWRAFQRHHGREGAPALFWWAPSAVMNPSLDPGLIADELVRAWYFLLTHRNCLLNDVDPEPQQAAQALAQVALSFAFHISERPDGCFEEWAGNIVKVNAASMKGARDFVYKNDLDAPLWRDFPADKWRRLTEKERQMLLPEGHSTDDPTGDPKGRAN